MGYNIQTVGSKVPCLFSFEVRIRSVSTSPIGEKFWEEMFELPDFFDVVTHPGPHHRIREAAHSDPVSRRHGGGPGADVHHADVMGPR